MNPRRRRRLRLQRGKYPRAALVPRLVAFVGANLRALTREDVEHTMPPKAPNMQALLQKMGSVVLPKASRARTSRK